MKTTHLNNAKKNKNDEFYTRLCDIENELAHYKEHFKDKTIYCNCDNPLKSNFVKYFITNFHRLKLKRLIATHYIANDHNIFASDPIKPFKLDYEVSSHINQEKMIMPHSPHSLFY